MHWQCKDSRAAKGEGKETQDLVGNWQFCLMIHLHRGVATQALLNMSSSRFERVEVVAYKLLMLPRECVTMLVMCVLREMSLLRFAASTSDDF